MSPASLSITAGNTNKVYGQTLTLIGFTTSGLTNSDTVGSVTLTSGGTTNTAAVGTYAIAATNAVGSGLTNYSLSYVSGTLVVSQASPSVSWTNPAAIYYGTPLSSLQLNASANVDGSFAYHPTNGAVLNVGTNTLTAVFTPSNSVDYLSVTNSVSLVVLPPNLPGTGTNITVNVAGNQLNLSWPTNYIGWLLQSNPLSLTSTGSWFLVPGSAGTNLVQITIDPASPMCSTA